jgi:nucleoside-diphosphate-sugar epimerase
LVEQVTGRKIVKRMRPPRAIDVSFSVLNCSKAHEDFGWNAEIPLETSVAQIRDSWSS